MRRGLALRMAVLALVAPLLAGCAALQRVDGVRTQFVALRYIATARDLTKSHPLDRPKVKRYLDRAVALRPNDSQVLESASGLYIGIDDYAAALTQLDQIARLTGGTNQVLRGQCLLMTGKREQGRALLYEAVKVAEVRAMRHMISSQGLAITLNGAGYTMADAGIDLDNASRMIDTAVRLAPLVPAFTDSLGWVLYRKGEYKRAAFYLERAVRQMEGPPDAALYYHLGMAYSALGKRFWAERALGQALEIDPQNAQAEDALRRLRYELPLPNRV